MSDPLSPPPSPLPQPPYGQAGYSPQYSFWPYYLTPPEVLLGPARRASLMLFLLAAMLLLSGTCLGIAVTQLSDSDVSRILEESQRLNSQQAMNFTPSLIRAIYGTMGVIIALCGIVAVVLGIFVRGGGQAWAIIALVLVFLPTLAAAVMVLSSLLGGPAAFLSAVLVMVIPFVLFAMTIKFLIGAIRAAPQVEAAKQQTLMAHQQQQAQYYAYAQQQQQGWQEQQQQQQR